MRSVAPDALVFGYIATAFKTSPYIRCYINHNRIMVIYDQVIKFKRGVNKNKCIELSCGRASDGRNLPV